MLGLSKTQIDRLGDRLRKLFPSEEDLILLDDYRRSFGDAYETVVRTIRERYQFEPTGRPAKSTRAIIEKLNRETIRLTQVQDIAGCRVIVNDLGEQDRFVDSVRYAFPKATVVDRRANPSYGYRAVHVIAKISDKLVEIQIRTPLQHLWAEISEKFSDVEDPAIKYGGGPTRTQGLLDALSKAGQHFEAFEKQVLDAEVTDDQNQQELHRRRQQAIELKTMLRDAYSKLLEMLDRRKERPS